MQSLREADLCDLLRSWIGLTAKDVAARLGVPPHTVIAQVAAVHRKLVAQQRRGAPPPFGDHKTTPDEIETAILELGVKLASEVTSLDNHPLRADYLRIDGDTVTPLARPGGRNGKTREGFPLREHPFVAEIVAHREARAGVLRSRAMGPHAFKMAADRGIAAGAGVPVIRKGSVHGILSISSPGPQPSREVVHRLAQVGRVIEAALANRP